MTKRSRSSETERPDPSGEAAGSSPAAITRRPASSKDEHLRPKLGVPGSSPGRATKLRFGDVVNVPLSELPQRARDKAQRARSSMDEHGPTKARVAGSSPAAPAITQQRLDEIAGLHGFFKSIHKASELMALTEEQIQYIERVRAKRRPGRPKSIEDMRAYKAAKQRIYRQRWKARIAQDE